MSHGEGKKEGERERERERETERDKNKPASLCLWAVRFETIIAIYMLDFVKRGERGAGPRAGGGEQVH